jgi:hypothetical protein
LLGENSQNNIIPFVCTKDHTTLLWLLAQPFKTEAEESCPPLIFYLLILLFFLLPTFLDDCEEQRKIMAKATLCGCATPSFLLTDFSSIFMMTVDVKQDQYENVFFVVIILSSATVEVKSINY